jgi:hypothetical protein
MLAPWPPTRPQHYCQQTASAPHRYMISMEIVYNIRLLICVFVPIYHISCVVVSLSCYVTYLISVLSRPVPYFRSLFSLMCFICWFSVSCMAPSSFLSSFFYLFLSSLCYLLLALFISLIRLFYLLFPLFCFLFILDKSATQLSFNMVGMGM